MNKNEKLISISLEDMRIQMDSLIKEAAEKHGINNEWHDLVAIKDQMGYAEISFKELETLNEK